MIAKVMSKLLPDFSNGRKLPDPTSDKHWMKVIQKDPMFWKGGDKADFSHAMFKSMDNVRLQYKSFRTPFLLMLSENDSLVDPKGGKQFYKEAPSRDKSILFFNDGIHHFFIEKPSIRNYAISSAIKWIINRISD